MAANKPTDKQSVSKKSDVYNPVNMAGKKTSPKPKSGSTTGEKQATPSDYNPVNMAGKKGDTSAR